MKPTVPAFLATLALAAVANPAEAHSRHRYAEPVGTVLVANRTAVPVTVYVEGGGSRTLPAYATQAFSAEFGRATVRASFVQYGGAVSLLDREVRVRWDRAAYVEVVPPAAGRVQVVNDTGIRSEVFVDGREVAELSAGTSRILTLPLGRAELRMVANGREVQAACVDVRPFSDTVLVGEAPRFADVVVSNPLPIAVDVRVAGTSRRVAAYGRATFDDVAVGVTDVTVARPGGPTLDVDRAYVAAWTGAFVTVDAPRTGPVRLDSHDDDRVDVFVDGRFVATVAPGAEPVVELPVGGRSIEVRRADGCFVEREFVVVDAYRLTDVDFGRYERGQHGPDQGRDAERHDDGRHEHRDDVSERDDRERHHEPATW